MTHKSKEFINLFIEETSKQESCSWGALSHFPYPFYQYVLLAG